MDNKEKKVKKENKEIKTIVKEKKNNGFLKFFIFYIITVASAVGAAILVVKFVPVESKVVTETVNKTMVSEEGIEEAITGVYDAVVTVKSYYGETLVGTGSGFVYKKEDKNGYIITNNHVIENANKYEVLLQNGDGVEAKLLGCDEYSDLAVLSIDADKVIKVAKLGDNELLATGNTVFTVGSPMGSEYSGSVTKGIVSAKDRTVENDNIVTKVIQTDAAINPGNSGGPLVNMAGEVVGITSMKLSATQIEGMGFAIPINDAMVYVKNLEKGEKISRPTIGVSLINVNERYKLFYYGINVDRNIEKGLVVAKVEKNSAAAKAGLEMEDVIVKIDGKEVDSLSKLRYYLFQYKIGDKIKLTCIRDKKEIDIEVKLEGE
ncbi:MAG: trypsin-like peptidase domain-containing protein [Bacilli bacterium]|nr:trypsin-like peptidase domain-containing protein [Bacilli bacterium]